MTFSDRVSDDEIDILDDAGFNPHDIKVGLGPGAWFDLYKDKKGNIYIWRKGGMGVPDPTGINIKDLP